MRGLTIFVIIISLFNAVMYAFGLAEPTVFSAVCNNVAIACFAGSLISTYPKKVK